MKNEKKLTVTGNCTNLPHGWAAAYLTRVTRKESSRIGRYPQYQGGVFSATHRGFRGDGVTRPSSNVPARKVVTKFEYNNEGKIVKTLAPC